MNILLSIKPEYVESITNGIKKYEFRKTIFRSDEVEQVFVYSTSPVKKIVGAFTIGEINEGTPSLLWYRFKDESGLEKDDFFGYFGNRNHGYAIEIEEFMEFRNPIDPWKVIDGFVPPQSFWYIDWKMMNDCIMSNYLSREKQIVSNKTMKLISKKGVKK